MEVALVVYCMYALTLLLAFFRKPERPANRHGTAPASTMRILVVGATGGTGRELVTQALALDYEVTAFVRDPSKMDITHERLTLARGDVLDYDSLVKAVHGQDAVISALGHKRYMFPTRILSHGTRNILKAMKAEGVPRFVCETSLGIGDSAGRMGLYYTFFVIPVILQFYFWDKIRQERLIRSSSSDWVIVRPGSLTNGSPRGTYRTGSGVGNWLRTVRVARADVAEFMLRQLRDDGYLRSSPGICW